MFGFLDALPAVTGALGYFDAQRRAKNAAAEQQAAATQYAGDLHNAESNLLGSQIQSQYSQAGTGNDAIQSFGRNLGGALAGAGVYNSSATAGALANATQGQQSALADLIARNKAAFANLQSTDASRIYNARAGLAQNNYNDAREQLGEAGGGLQSALGSLTQRYLARNAVPNTGGRQNAFIPDSGVIGTASGVGPPAPPTVQGMGSASYGGSTIFRPTSSPAFARPTMAAYGF